MTVDPKLVVAHLAERLSRATGLPIGDWGDPYPNLLVLRTGVIVAWDDETAVIAGLKRVYEEGTVPEEYRKAVDDALDGALTARGMA